MSKKTINFDNKKINKSSLKLIKDYFIIDDIKRNHGKKVHLNTLLLIDILIILAYSSNIWIC